VLGAAAVAALFGNLGYLGMVLEDLHRTELQARQAQLDETASRTAAEQTALELQALLAQRDELAEEREGLLQMLAHEIRQPLQSAGQAMQGAVQVLRDPRGAPAAQVGAQLMQAQAVLGEVRSVLDNTLAAATLLSRGTPLVRQEVALDFLVELTLGDLGARQLDRLTVDWRTDIDSLEVEPGLVRLALRNLLTNAFAHGGPQVNVRLTIDALPHGAGLRLVVADDGPGMSPAQLLDPPSQPGQPARRRLGLSIVRQVMDLHGGQLVLGNELPRGFVAQLVFPLPADDWGLDDDLAEALVGADPERDQAGTSGARNT
jgi:signal transduction histidine kinase